MKHPPRIMLVDDHPDQLAFATSLLEQNGYTVDQARHGAEALVRAHQHPPNLIVSDLLMPVMDGYALLKRCRSDPVLRTVPFAIWTGTYTDKEDEQLARELGADCFLRKPTAPKDLLDCVSSLLAAGSSAAGTASNADLTTRVGDVEERLRSTVSRKLEQRTAELERANRELAARESELQLAIEAAGLGTFEWDMRTGAIVWSDRANAIWGFAPGEFPGTLKAAQLRVHIDDQAGLKTAIKAATQQQQTFDQNFRVLWPDQSVHWLQAKGRFVFAPDGKPVLTRGVFMDQTARHEAEQLVEDALANLRAIVQASPIGILCYDEHGQATMANEAAARLVGASVPELLQQNFHRIDSWRQSGLYEIATRALRECRNEHFETRFVTTFGRAVHFSGHFVPLPRGTVLHLLFLFTDISSRIRDEASMRLQIAALNAAANTVVITDREGTIVWVNEAFTRTTGYTPLEVIGQNPRVLKSGRHPTEFYRSMWQTIQAGAVWHGEIHNRRKNGTDFTEDVMITPVRDPSGNLTHFIAIKQDITERKQLEQRFLRAQRLEGIGLLAGGIAHDLNNVLAPILMAAELMRMQATDPRSIDQLDVMLRSAKRGADIVKQVLTFARGVEGERIPLDPKHIIREMYRLARETFPRSIRVKLELPPTLQTILGDPTQLHQALLNLCVNARDAMPDGGELLLTAANLDIDEATARLHFQPKPGPHVVIQIKDSGTGIPPELIDRIFEPFFTTKETGKGTGLGLSTVVGIVRSHGGFLTVTSEPRRGSCFCLHLPASSTPVAPTAPQPTALPPRAQGERILVVDDEPAILQMTRKILENHGYRVLTAPDGAAGLSELARRVDDVRLVLTDLRMPFMDGLQFSRAARRLVPETRIVLCTGAAEHSLSQEDLAALGLGRALDKPCNRETLLRRIHEELYPDQGG